MQPPFDFDDELLRPSKKGHLLSAAPHYYTNNSADKPSSIFAEARAIEDINRPIHYLGSKLRLVKPLCELVDRVDPSDGTICDLFAGSGTVSKAFSKRRDVISVDIQEYSRVLCSALLQPTEIDSGLLEQFRQNVRSAEHAEQLFAAIEPLALYEAECLRQAHEGTLEPLCDFLEHGSLMALEQGVCDTASARLRSAMTDVHARLKQLRYLEGADALATRHFGGVYFSFVQAAQLDVWLKSIEVVPPQHKDTFLAAALSTASEVVNTVGKQFAQPLRPRTSGGEPKENLYRLVARDRFIDVLNLSESWLNRYLASAPERKHLFLRKDYAAALEEMAGRVSIVYADPPYTRDHYSRFYHVLETLCLRDNPIVSTVRINGEDRISRGFYRSERHQSPFCIKSKAAGACSKLFEQVRSLDVPLVLSYSPYEKETGARPRLLTEDEIVELAKRFFKQVEVTRVGGVVHNKLNSSEKNVGVSYNAEILVTCTP